MNAYSSNTLSFPRVTFLGAARTVTGSMHLVEVGPYRLLLDCGLTRGPREQSRILNQHFPFDPTTIDAVIISHAHVDHGGNLPNLLKQGYRGPIYCTPATRDLLSVMLHDSARIQEDEAHIATVSGKSKESERKPLYTYADVRLAIENSIPVGYNQPTTLNPDIQLTFIDAGHILGSAIVSLKMLHGGREYRLVFSGDIGRRGLPFLKDPSRIPAGDLIICESTYGGKTHDTLESMSAKMSDIVRRTVSRGGKVLIPAFSLGRTQLVLHYLRQWMCEGLLPELPIYVDSPLATEISLIYDDYAEESLQPTPATFEPEFMLSQEEARGRSTQRDPCIIVASGGMCEGGRILYHLKHHIDDPRSTVVLVSYQAPLSLGAQMLEARPTVRFHGRTWNKWIEVVELNGFSGHADQEDFKVLLDSASGQTQKIRLVHGEVLQSEALALSLQRMGFADVAVPDREEVVNL